MLRHLWITLVLAGCCLAPASVPGADEARRLPADVQAILDKAAQIELWSLDPTPSDEKPKHDFHGWKVLGKTIVKDRKLRQRLLAAVARGVAKNDGSVPDCFEPRHGIRATHDGKTVDLVLCFQCLQIQVYLGKQQPRRVLTTDSPQPVLDRLLRDARVPLAPKARK